jgi:ferric-dicitrate binding protein FerR (iron transport regulator)
MFRVVAPFVVAVATVALVGGVAFAADKTHDGLVVSVAEGKLTMTDDGGKNEHSHSIGKGTKITLDSKDAKLEDLKKGDKITVTQNDAGVVTALKATRPAK